MLKKGGFFLALFLCATSLFAQDKTAEMFRPDNPNLMNLGEAKEYTGSPLVYIEGVKAPEVANNELEELQLKLFGTKNVQEATQNNLELSKELPSPPDNQIQNYTFQTPFHQTVNAAFIHHIPNFVVMIHLVERNKVVVTEHITVMNTDQDLIWTRKIPLPPTAFATITNYMQNGTSFPVQLTPQTHTLVLTSPQPLKLGPNQLSLTYQIENPLTNDLLNLDVTGTELSWPIEQFQALVLLPTVQTLQASKLTFGTNHLDIPDIYTQQTDTHSNIFFQINRIVPPNASIQTHLQLDLKQLPDTQATSISTLVIWGGLILLVLYWLGFAWWNKHLAPKIALSKIHPPKNPILFSLQTSIPLTQNTWQKLYDFYAQNQGPSVRLNKQYEHWQKHTLWELIKATFQNFILLTYEVILGTLLLTMGILGLLFYLNQRLPIWLCLLYGGLSFCAWILLYFFALQPAQRVRWQQRWTQLSSDTVLLGLTVQQIRHLYPLFLLSNQEDAWRQKLIQINPKAAQDAHLL